MTPYPHQVEISQKAYEILKKYGIVYLAMLERTGKTLTAILTCEKSPYLKRVLVVTKCNALKGWNDTLNSYKSHIEFVVMNYESLHKLECKDFDAVILDESHSFLSRVPKVGARWKTVSSFTKGLPIIYLSATPSAQGYHMLYPQFKLSSWSPFRKYPNYYKWYADYGIPKRKFRNVIDYTSVKSDKVYNEVKHLFISYTRQELGFKYEPEDVLHFVKLKDSTLKLYKSLETDKVIRVNDVEIIADTPANVLTKLHQLEGGTLKNAEDIIMLDNTEKIDYILNKFGDTDSLVIFYNYVAEKVKLEQHFKHAKILQASAYAEGVDLSMFETLVVYSMNFSTAQYTQRRARQANLKRETPIKVHFILVKNAISHQVYKTVAINKTNFVDKYYQKGLL